MDPQDLLALVLADDAAVEAKKQTEVLKKIEENTRPDPMGGNNNWYTVIDVDLTVLHSSEEVWHREGPIKANSVTIPSLDIDYWYEIDYGRKVKVEAGLNMEIAGHMLERLLITTEEASTGVMSIVISGIDTSKTGT